MRWAQGLHRYRLWNCILPSFGLIWLTLWQQVLQDFKGRLYYLSCTLRSVDLAQHFPLLFNLRLTSEWMFLIEPRKCIGIGHLSCQSRKYSSIVRGGRQEKRNKVQIGYHKDGSGDTSSCLALFGVALFPREPIITLGGRRNGSPVSGEDVSPLSPREWTTWFIDSDRRGKDHYRTFK